MDEPDPRRLSNAVDSLSEMEQTDKYPLPLRHQIVRILGILISSIVLMGIGGAMNAHSKNIVEQEFSYDFNCTQGRDLDLYTRKCDKFNITIEEKISKPVYVYYHLTEFWQNHFLYVRSLSGEQLYGDDLTSVGDCKGTKFGGKLDTHEISGKIIVPCGLQGWSHFNDEIIVDVKDSIGATKCINCLTYENIALKIDHDRFELFNATIPENSNEFTHTVNSVVWNDEHIRGNTTIPNLQDESLMVWMRYAPTSNFKKIHSIIQYDLEKGDVVELSITSKFNTEVYSGKKSLIFTETGSFGGKHNFLSIMFILAGVLPFCIVCITLLVHFYVAKKNHADVW